MPWWMWLLSILVLLSLIALIILLLRWARRRPGRASEPVPAVLETVPASTATEAEVEPRAADAVPEIGPITEVSAAEITETQPDKTAAEAEPATEAVAEAPPPSDDLEIIEGIGPKISSVFGAAGITTLAQLAATEAVDLKRILTEANIRLGDPTTWPEQARLAAEAKWDELAALQDSLKGGRRV